MNVICFRDVDNSMFDFEEDVEFKEDVRFIINSLISNIKENIEFKKRTTFKTNTEFEIDNSTFDFEEDSFIFDFEDNDIEFDNNKKDIGFSIEVDVKTGIEIIRIDSSVSTFKEDIRVVIDTEF